MSEYITRGRLQIARVLDTFINDQALVGTQIESAAFWAALPASIKRCWLSVSRCKS
ncbi:hypothetical protein CA267_015180 [Alteromonas pelagimontana]|uniref:Uncharacterized protein n=1 Tax=Alteromonas pelagimontana TaxID=1858656 RepID=A0A6M4MFW0_9ALTE|nr:hypothetical protein [Alteromonas pelagimontana]QJR81999.1 hypothetical protein CA267_015180 [Alteromonas pelagimontana]